MPQQCIEKIMKAALIELNEIPPKTHDLHQLYLLIQSHCDAWNPEPGELRFHTQTAVGIRYPGDTADYQEAEEALRICVCLREMLFQLPFFKP